MRRVHKQKIILPSSHDSDSSHIADTLHPKNQMTYSERRFPKKSALFIAEFIPALILLVVPFSVHAGLLSKMFTLFTPEVIAEADVDSINNSPQNTPLLNAIKNPDPQKAIGGGDITYEDGALISTGPVGKDEVSASHASNGAISVYVVREGDSLSQIAEMYGVTSNTILWANDIAKATDIYPGQTLVILPIVGLQHTVLKGETLASIIKKYGGDLDEILKYNDLASAGAISVGDTITIPGGEIHSIQVAVSSTPTPTKTSGKKTSSTKGGSWLINPAPGSVETQGIHGYNAVDLASYGGAHIPVIAAAAGEVIVSKSSGWNGGYGQYVVIKHNNGEQTLYGHLSKNLVGVGDVVAQGQQIGAMGATGEATGVHVHFEVRGGTNPF